MYGNHQSLSRSTPEFDNGVQNNEQNKNNQEPSSCKSITLGELKESIKLLVSSPQLLNINSKMHQESTILLQLPAPCSTSTGQPVIPSPSLTALPSAYYQLSKFSNSESINSLSLLKQKTALTNDLITGISGRYIERITLLQNTNKANKQKLSLCAQKVDELTNQSQRHQREIVFLKEKLDLFESENAMMRFQTKQLESANRELHFSLQTTNHENQSIKTQLDLLKKRQESSEKERKEMLDALTHSYTIAQAEKEKLECNNRNLRAQIQKQTSLHVQQKKDLSKSFGHEKHLLMKRIKKLQNQLKEYINRASQLEIDQTELKKSIELDKDHDKRMKSEIEELNNRIYKLRQSLSFAENSLVYAEEEMKTLMVQNEETIKQLKSNLLEKEQLISILRSRNNQLETVVAGLQQQITYLSEQVQRIQQTKSELQGEKKDLNDKVSQLQHSIAKLVSQIESYEQKGEIFHLHLSNLEQQRDQMEDINKKIAHTSAILKDQVRRVEAELDEQTQKAKTLQQEASTLKIKNKELFNEVFKLNFQNLTLSQEVARLASETEQFDHKQSMLQSQIGELKGQKQLKQSLFMEKISALSKRERSKQKQIEELSQELDNFRSRLGALSDQIREKHNEVINKDGELHQVQEEMYELRGDNLRLDQQLQTALEECARLKGKLGESEEEVEKLREYVEELEGHINELDNILVWDFEEGKGESNNYIQRKEKMLYIVTLLHQKIAEIDSLNTHKEYVASVLQEEQKTNEDYKNLIAKFNEKIATFLQEKEGLTRMIQDIEVNNKTLTEKLNDLKEKQVQWRVKERGLNRKVKYKEDLIRLMNDEKNALLQKLQSLQKRVKDKQLKVDMLSQQYSSEREKSANLKQMIERLTAERRRMEDQNTRKIKELNIKYQAEKRENQERKGSITKIQIDKKAQINTLSIQLAELKNEAKEFMTFFESEKFNYSKRNLCLVDLGTALGKFEKTNNIKAHLTAPLRDLIKKMEQFDNNSSKLFSKYAKFKDPKEA